jgi:hypothetical protein
MQWFDYTKTQDSTHLREPRSKKSAHTDRKTETSEYSYRQLCNRATNRYQEQHAPCEFEYTSTISRDVYPCVKKYRHHGDLHRILRKSKVSDKEFYGRFDTEFIPERFRWDEQVLRWLRDTEPGIGMTKEAAKSQVVRQHLIRLRTFFSKTLLDTEVFHTTCLSCFNHPPEHKLPCGHLICTPCARDFGKIDGGHGLSAAICPLHESKQWAGSERLATLQPPSAGLRVLSLDGYVHLGFCVYFVLMAIGVAFEALLNFWS